MIDKTTQEQALKLLDALAQQMGVAAGQVWRIEVAQAHTYGLIFGVLDLLALSFIAFLAYQLTRLWRLGDDGHPEPQMLALFGWTILSLWGYYEICCLGTHALTALSPEHYAMESIAGMAGRLTGAR